MNVTAVVAACIVEDGYVLLQGRENENRLKDFFELPGGKVEEGEILEQALEREILEEIDCIVTHSSLIHAQINKYPPDPNSYLVLFYYCNISGRPKPLVGSVNWVPFNNLHVYKTLPGLTETVSKVIKLNIHTKQV